MTYEETIAYLYQSQPVFHLVGSKAYKPGLDNIRRLLAHIGQPHERFLSIHIAGTNGKGSTSHLIAAALQSMGLKVGLYTSPHLVDFRERIRINGQMISQDAVVQFVAENQSYLEQVRPSFFETTQALAFAYFAQEKVDIAVVECGLGGRLDATNCLSPILSVITNIGMDHTEFLGHDLAAIAFEKAGIIKPHTPCVIGESDPETIPVFLSRAAECGILGDGLETSDCKLWFADQCGYLRRKREREVPTCQLRGLYQSHNMQTAYVALQSLLTIEPFRRLLSERHSAVEPCKIPTAAEATPTNANAAVTETATLSIRQSIAEGFANVCTLTGLRGRWEVLSRSPLTICDTGHNSHGIRYVAAQLEQLIHSTADEHTEAQTTSDRPSKQSELRIVFGMVSDKDIAQVIALLPKAAHYYFTQPSSHRAYPAGSLLADFLAASEPSIAQAETHTQAHSPMPTENHTQSHSQKPSYMRAAFPSVKEAILAAKTDAHADDILFIGGSNYVVGEALALFDA